LRYLFRAHKTPCPPGKDIRAYFSGLSRLRGLFRGQVLSGNKKISFPSGRDLNFRYPTGVPEKKYGTVQQKEN
jgi:hypothetical protein